MWWVGPWPPPRSREPPNRLGDVGLGLAHRLDGGQALGQPRGDGGGEGAARPVSVGRVEAGGGDLVDGLAVEGGVDGVVGVRQVAALDDDDLAIGAPQPPGGGAGVLQGADETSGQRARLVEVGGHDVGEGQQPSVNGSDGVLRQQGAAALGDHDRIDDEVGEAELFQQIAQPVDQRRGGEHARLDRVDADVGAHAAQLRLDEVEGELMCGLDAERVLGGDRGHHRHAEDTEGGEGLEIGLDTGAAPAVGAGDGERPRNGRGCAAGGHASAPAKWSHPAESSRRSFPPGSTRRRPGASVISPTAISGVPVVRRTASIRASVCAAAQVTMSS